MNFQSEAVLILFYLCDFLFSLTDMITLFEAIFGAKFWSNVMFVVTRNWGHTEIEVNKRGDKNEAWFAKKWNDIIRNEDRLNMDPSLTIPMVFISSHYDILNQKDPNEKVDPDSRAKFYQYTQELWEKASTIKPFHLIDIKMALTEIHKLKKAKEELASNNTELLRLTGELQTNIKHMEEKTELIKCSGPLGWLTCSKNWVRVLGLICSVAIGFLLGVIVICTCNNPCTCCSSCFKSCGNCCRWKCCQTGMFNYKFLLNFPKLDVFRWWKGGGYEKVGGMWTFRSGGLRKTHCEIRLSKVKISFDFNDLSFRK